LKKPNRTQNEKKNRTKTEKNQAKLKKPSQTGKIEPNRFEPGFFKNQTESKSVGLKQF